MWVGGTSAFLKSEDILTLHDLLYAMMLPSGNDAAITISNWGGQVLQILALQKREDLASRASSHSRCQSNQNHGRKSVDLKINVQKAKHNSQILLSDYEFGKNNDNHQKLNGNNVIINNEKYDQDREYYQQRKKKTHGNNFNLEFKITQQEILESLQFCRLTDQEVSSNVERFIKEMNKYSIKLGMRDSLFLNPHGLSFKGNKSTVQDVSRLCTYFLANQLLKQVVKTRFYSAKSSKGNSYTWQNTNILLKNPNCFGLKTGLTPNAGACIAVLYNLGKKSIRPSTQLISQLKYRRNDLEGFIIIVLLGATVQNKRFSEADKLIQWVDECYTRFQNKLTLSQENYYLRRENSRQLQRSKQTSPIKNQEQQFSNLRQLRITRERSSQVLNISDEHCE